MSNEEKIAELNAEMQLICEEIEHLHDKIDLIQEKKNQILKS